MRITPLSVSLASEVAAGTKARVACVHCGLDCPPNPPRDHDHAFCCQGCLMAYRILSDHGLDRFYTIESAPGVRPQEVDPAFYAALDQPEVRRRVVDFSNGTVSRVTFRIPAIHCAACVWLLENLYRLVPGVGRSEVHFPRKEVTLFVEDAQVPLSALAARLASLGYAPELKLDRLTSVTQASGKHRLLIQIGIAGFAFGNVMLMSIPSYLGLDPHAEASLQRFFGFASLLLSIPVLLFSAQDYFRGAWTGLRQRLLTIDFPIALGITALFLQSTADILRHTGEGYLDSFTGLVFLLLCGKWLQRNTYDAIAFDRDYTSYFPLAVTRRKGGQDESVPLNNLVPGDRVVIRHGELIPADAVIVSGTARLDYSFVTGEAEPVTAVSGDYVYAGARQMGDVLEADLVKDVSQSYLTSLWNNDAFRKPREYELQNMTNLAGRWFTVAVVILAACTALYWWVVDPTQVARTFAAVLIVACPCALALAAPFTFGTAQRLLGRAGLFLRSPSVVEAFARAKVVVFDKTGTLTTGQTGEARHEGGELTREEMAWVTALARCSTHPLSRAIAAGGAGGNLPPVEALELIEGEGLSGTVAGHRIHIGKAGYVGAEAGGDAGGAWVSIDGTVRGRFLTDQTERSGLIDVVRDLSAQGLELTLLSGDRDTARARFEALLGAQADLRFGQSPHDKLDYIRKRQDKGQRVMMIGDGLNDAGALRQSDVGIAVSEDVTLFSPACDAVLSAPEFSRLPAFHRYSRSALGILRAAFALSLLYNVIGLSFAATGMLSPLVSAVLMPVSSLSVVLFTTAATTWAARRAGVTG
ncbi:MAG: heavy metal translocating P-type ATPase metal-binding domain-containing protein [Verrucomicrobia bacterium]|nr:heavy metal translocating P-type ATPase metal-binding domain-containing protein [Verrucomicrobiota bacterium]